METDFPPPTTNHCIIVAAAETCCSVDTYVTRVVCGDREKDRADRRVLSYGDYMSLVIYKLWAHWVSIHSNFYGSGVDLIRCSSIKHLHKNTIQ